MKPTRAERPIVDVAERSVSARRDPRERTERAAPLADRTRAQARAFAEALFTPEGGSLPGARLEWLVDELDDFVRHAGREARTVLTSSLAAIAAAVPLALGVARSFASLSVDERVRGLERVERTPLGLAILGAKAMVCIVWYEHPESARDIDHDGACLDPSTGAP
jgi:hypothetical protein